MKQRSMRGGKPRRHGRAICAAVLLGASVLLGATVTQLQGQRPKHLAGMGVPGSPCAPVTATYNEATTKVGCFIVAEVPQGAMRDEAVYWHVFDYSLSTHPAVLDGSFTIVKGLSRTWLLAVGARGLRPPSGAKRVVEVGPLHVKRGVAYTAQYMVAVFKPGMTTPVHRHPGPEAWYTLSGEVCLETPEGKQVGRAGESSIVPAGPPMKLTATGGEMRRSLVLVLHESAKPPGIPAPDWTPKGLCK